MKIITADMAREALHKAQSSPAGSYNTGYLNGYADALREVTGLQYYAVSADGKTYTWQWLTPEEVEEHRRAGYTVTK